MIYEYISECFYDDCSLFAFLYTTIDSFGALSINKCSIWGDKKQLREIERKIPVKQFKSEVLTISYGFTLRFFVSIQKSISIS